MPYKKPETTPFNWDYYIRGNGDVSDYTDLSMDMKPILWNACIVRGEEELFCGDLNHNRLQRVLSESKRNKVPLIIMGEGNSPVLVAIEGKFKQIDRVDWFDPYTKFKADQDRIKEEQENMKEIREYEHNPDKIDKRPKGLGELFK